MDEPSWEQIQQWQHDYEWCYVHGYEPEIENPYKICGECFHIYPTAFDLVQDYNDENYKAWLAFDQGTPWIPTYDVDKIYFCAHCAHDF